MNTHRTITLLQGRNYTVGCSLAEGATGSPTWTGDHITAEPAHKAVTAAYVSVLETKRLLHLQNFTEALSGNYTCRGNDGNEKKLTIVSGEGVFA